MKLFATEMFATNIASFFSYDVLISAVVVILMALRAHKQGLKTAWLAILGTLTVEVSLGLPLYLFLNVIHKERAE